MSPLPDLIEKAEKSNPKGLKNKYQEIDEKEMWSQVDKNTILNN